MLEDVAKIVRENNNNNDEAARKIASLIERNRRDIRDATRVDYTQNVMAQYSNSSSISAAPPVFMSRLHLTLEHLPTTMFKERCVFNELVKVRVKTNLIFK